MATPKITLYFDIVSPFAYIAFHVLRVCMAIAFRRVTDPRVERARVRPSQKTQTF